MRRAAALALVGGFVGIMAGCSSPLKNTGSSDASACPISGNYSVIHTFEEMSPGCAAANGLTTTSDTYSFSVDEGVVTLIVASLGGSCSGEANGCDLPLSCSAMLNSGGSAMFTTTYVFTSTGFSGRLILIEMPTGGGTCEYVYQDTGTLMQ